MTLAYATGPLVRGDTYASEQVGAGARLHRRWQRLHTQRRKPSGVVAVACARELSGFLWEAATLT